jgi:ATP-dependent helicase HrpA
VKRALNLSPDAAYLTRYFGGRAAFEKSLYEALLQKLFELDIRDREGFLEEGERLRPHLLPMAKALRDMAIELLQTYHQVRTTLNALEADAGNNPAVRGLLEVIRGDLEILVPANFASIYPEDRLRQIPRYLKGMEIRAQRGANDLNKDQKKAVQLEAYLKALKKTREGLSPYASEEKREAVEEFRWMVEEFKVSLFAQELKTPYPVSPKRMEEQIAEIERMV